MSDQREPSAWESLLPTYTISRVFCNNCGARAEDVKISKGRRVEHWPCPTCGCYALVKSSL
jgi:hypothetical protein